MTRKDFKAIAVAIKDSASHSDGTPGSNYTLRIAASQIADVFEADNPRFDRSKFLTACGF